MIKYRIVEDNGVFTPQIRDFLWFVDFEKYNRHLFPVTIRCSSFNEALNVINRHKRIKKKVIHKIV